MKFELTKVEQSFFNKKHIGRQSTKIPYLIVDNFPDLGLLTTLRFLEWSLENPKGVVSLPTGKTPEYFIKSSHYILNKWGTDDVNNICKNYGLNPKIKPNLSDLRFVQIDEFYPLNPKQHNSFYHYVNKYYIEGFNFSKKNHY